MKDTVWTDFDKQSVEAHFDRLKEDFSKGFIHHVGRTEDPTGEGFGIVIFQANNLEEATDYMMKDPAIMHGQMTGKVFEYRLVFHKN